VEQVDTGHGWSPPAAEQRLGECMKGASAGGTDFAGVIVIPFDCCVAAQTLCGERDTALLGHPRYS
jgi:hypothetical protein